MCTVLVLLLCGCGSGQRFVNLRHAYFVGRGEMWLDAESYVLKYDTPISESPRMLDQRHFAAEYPNDAPATEIQLSRLTEIPVVGTTSALWNAEHFLLLRDPSPLKVGAVFACQRDPNGLLGIIREWPVERWKQGLPPRVVSIGGRYVASMSGTPTIVDSTNWHEVAAPVLERARDVLLNRDRLTRYESATLTQELSFLVAFPERGSGDHDDERLLHFVELSTGRHGVVPVFLQTDGGPSVLIEAAESASRQMLFLYQQELGADACFSIRDVSLRSLAECRISAQYVPAWDPDHARVLFTSTKHSIQRGAVECLLWDTSNGLKSTRVLNVRDVRRLVGEKTR